MVKIGAARKTIKNENRKEIYKFYLNRGNSEYAIGLIVLGGLRLWLTSPSHPSDVQYGPSFKDEDESLQIDLSIGLGLPSSALSA